MNLYAMLNDAIRRQPRRTAISYSDRMLTFSALDQAAAAVGQHFASLGSQGGDRVLLFLRNGL